jgi:hypothetical protein
MLSVMRTWVLTCLQVYKRTNNNENIFSSISRINMTQLTNNKFSSRSLAEQVAFNFAQAMRV